MKETGIGFVSLSVWPSIRIHCPVKGLRFVLDLGERRIVLIDRLMLFGSRVYTFVALDIYCAQSTVLKIHNIYKCPTIKKNYVGTFSFILSAHCVRLHAVFLHICHHFIPFCNRDKAGQSTVQRPRTHINRKDTRDSTSLHSRGPESRSTGLNSWKRAKKSRRIHFGEPHWASSVCAWRTMYRDVKWPSADRDNNIAGEYSEWFICAQKCARKMC